MGPATSREIADARDAGLELVIVDGEVPEECASTSSSTRAWAAGGWPSSGARPRGRRADEPLRLRRHGRRLHGAPDRALRRRDAEYASLTRHLANSAGVLRYPAARFDAARCGIALYGISPFGTDPADDGLEPALRWESQLAQVRLVQPGRVDGLRPALGRGEPTWIGIVPVGYADGFRRDLTGTEVRVAGEPRRVVGTISMDAFAVELDRELPVGTPVTLLGHGVLAEAHARVAETIGYEIVTGIRSAPERTRRSVVDS